MLPRPDQSPARPVRRSPALGVGGVTLLMLVTLVLTTSPALGRSRDVSPTDIWRLDSLSERAVPTQRVERRTAGQREQPDRDARADAAARRVCIRLARASILPLTIARPHEWGESRANGCARDGAQMMLRNLPPPTL